MKKLQINKKHIGIALVLIIILIVAFVILLSRGTEITLENFPKKIGDYRLTDVQTIEKNSEISTIVGQKISRTFISNFKGSSANVTLWILVPTNSYKQTIIANMLAASMSRKTDMFYTFTSITEGGFPVVTFTGPGEVVHNYIFFKSGKVFWLSIESNGGVNERFVFKDFFTQF